MKALRPSARAGSTNRVATAAALEPCTLTSAPSAASVRTRLATGRDCENTENCVRWQTCTEYLFVAGSKLSKRSAPVHVSTALIHSFKEVE